MLRPFVNLVQEAVLEGFDRGVHLFMETLNQDIGKSQVFNEYGVDNVISGLFKENNISLTENDLVTDNELKALYNL